MRKIIPPPTAFASFTGSLESLNDSDEALSRNLAENVDLPAIFRTMDQGVCPGMILSSDDGIMTILQGCSIVLFNELIYFAFAPIIDSNITVTLTKTDSGGAAIWIPGSEWYLEASTQSNTLGNLEIRNFSLSL